MGYCMFQSRAELASFHMLTWGLKSPSACGYWVAAVLLRQR